jgi:hypothetical protein
LITLPEKELQKLPTLNATLNCHKELPLEVDVKNEASIGGKYKYFMFGN